MRISGNGMRMNAGTGGGARMSPPEPRRFYPLQRAILARVNGWPDSADRRTDDVRTQISAAKAAHLFMARDEILDLHRI